MEKTVKEILREADGIKYQGNSASELLRKLSIEITKAYEKEIAEKDKEIEEFKKQQLYKEDFDIQYYCSYHGHWDQCVVESEEEATEEELSKYIAILKDNLKYDKLFSKDVK